ncbi:MAG TPA: type III restriction-modification system endonuclease [Clostridiaceae bacterium]|nr:type III restriction-modification system endonuclease [Clostridiaceae bacterium]
MELILQQGLPHQQEAVDRLSQVFEGVGIYRPRYYFENPTIDLQDIRLKENISKIQSSLPPDYRCFEAPSDCLNLDIKMETGTGKTYVYTKTMFELHKNYGINKFIIAVPSLAIKAGTAQFLLDPYARRHFSDSCGYGTEMEVGVLTAQTRKKNRRSYFPGAVSDFVKGSLQNTKRIYVLLTNMHLLTKRKNAMLARDDYDYGVEGFYRPLDALRATKPFIIIDEPHRFRRDQASYKVIAEEIKPQCVIRFGATFPDLSIGRGRNKITKKDYQNLLYDLNACASFNLDLIKGVAKEHLEPASDQNAKVKIVSLKSRESANFQYKSKNKPTKTYTLQKDDSLAIIDSAFEGITIDGISTNEVFFSNGQTKTRGEELDVDIYMTSYQEQMLRLALERHFETERENFYGRQYKIKTLALFFIDDITSYREDAEGKAPYLLEAFERLLKEKLKVELQNLSKHESEYRDYLEASLADISACHAGYFSRDNTDTDDDIAEEVREILHGKKELLSFRHKDGSWNTRRFLFSKWTLKEGWDNPNVFTIAKLRSSGSEISKLQEVGRGLRLPVDENGNRISNEEFWLNYIVDFTEFDFAEQLVKQINGELPQASVISEEVLSSLAQKHGIDADAMFDELYSKKYIDRHLNINHDNRDAMYEEYPELAQGLHSGKVKNLNKQKLKPIKIRKAVYQEMRELWEKINERYLLLYDRDLDEDLPGVLLTLLEREGIFTQVAMTSRREKVVAKDGNMQILEEAGTQHIVSRPLPYGKFLLRINKATNLPIKLLHQAICNYQEQHGDVEADLFNENSVATFCAEFQAWKTNALQGRFSYAKSSTGVGATALTRADGTVLDEIAQGRIGTKITSGTPSDKYLYDTFAYDSPLEHKNIMADIEEVVVYGKIPRSSIAIPTITGSTYSPDFIYIVKRASGEKELNLIVETKDVENKSSLRGDEAAKMECAKVFFENLSLDGYKVYFRDQLNNKQMVQIVNEVVGNS